MSVMRTRHNSGLRQMNVPMKEDGIMRENAKVFKTS